jgi:uncharacterized protein (DUF2062 family)
MRMARFYGQAGQCAADSLQLACNDTNTMRKHLRKYLPDHEAIRANRWLAPFGNTLLHPRLWHLNRRSAAGGFAVGLYCGLIPGPFQILGAAVFSVAFRVNLPLALFTTFYTNPFTIVPLYLVAYRLGRFALRDAGGEFVAPPEFSAANLFEWTRAMGDWMLGLGAPLALGVVLLANILAVLGYAIVRLGWRFYLIRAWHRRRLQRAGGG